MVKFACEFHRFERGSRELGFNRGWAQA